MKCAIASSGEFASLPGLAFSWAFTSAVGKTLHHTHKPSFTRLRVRNIVSFRNYSAKQSVAFTAAGPQVENPRLCAYVARPPSAGADCRLPSPSARVPASPVVSKPGPNDNGTGKQPEQGLRLAPARPEPAPSFRFAGTGSLVLPRPKHAAGSPLKLLPVLRVPGRRSLLAGPSDPDSNGDRKSTRLNSSHMSISYAVFCLKKKKKLSPAIFMLRGIMIYFTFLI